ncbi:MAG: EF-hand domain-containing protein [Archangium sp.]|nr:EF-hand domain-containing protein [Archangium sp.]MDP3155306.1 EF-hand domain-containing protein [Archangium sp.]MDP3570967.1 EF-hand domain-containing protein [Archangium sp.]
MATQKKKKPLKKVLKKVRAVAKKPAPKKKSAPPQTKAKKPVKAATRRNPPMHAKTRHQELDDDTERDEVFEVFKSFDRDGSGSIDARELTRLFEALGQDLPEEELGVALEVIDVNHSGRISWDEFKAWWSDR